MTMTRMQRRAIGVAMLMLLSGCAALKSKGGPKTPVVGQRVPILASETDVQTDKTMAGIPVTVPAAVANAAWGQPGGNASKSMGNLALGDTLNKAWSARVPGGGKFAHLAAAPVVSGGRLYVMDAEGAVHALDAQSGAEIWKTDTASKDDSSPKALFGGGVSVDGDRAYAANGLGEVVALDTADGKIVWRTRPAGKTLGAPLRGAPSLANGNVYVLSQDNQLFALTQADGTVVWTESGSVEAQGVFGVAAPASARGTVVAGFSSGELNAYRYENGRSLWADALSRTSASTSVSALADIDATPVIDGDRVYAVGQGGRMVALELLTGQRLWEQNIAGIANPWAAGQWVFVVSSDARLICLDGQSGKVRWINALRGFKNKKKKTGPIDYVGPVLAGGRLILLNSEGEMVTASVDDGHVLDTQKLGGNFMLGPVVANNMLYTLSDDGQITAWR